MSANNRRGRPLGSTPNTKLDEELCRAMLKLIRSGGRMAVEEAAEQAVNDLPLSEIVKKRTVNRIRQKFPKWRRDYQERERAEAAARGRLAQASNHHLSNNLFLDAVQKAAKAHELRQLLQGPTGREALRRARFIEAAIAGTDNSPAAQSLRATLEILRKPEMREVLSRLDQLTRHGRKTQE